MVLIELDPATEGSAMRTPDPERRWGSDTIAADLAEQIDTGILRPGDRLPPRHDLAARYRVDDDTAGRAAAALEETGRVRSRRGIDVTVTMGKPTPPTPPGKWGLNSMLTFLTKQIDDGVFQPGHELPSRRGLASLFAVSGTTAVRVTWSLASTGRVRGRQGAAVVVVGPATVLPPAEPEDSDGPAEC